MPISGTMTPLSATIWKYMFSSPENYLCQIIPNFSWYPSGDLRISDTSLFMLGQGSDSVPSRLLMYKITFGNDSPDWANYLPCPVSDWITLNSESVLISSIIYSFFIFGDGPMYLYLASMSSTDGSVSSKRYKNTFWMQGVDGLVTSGSNIIVATHSLNYAFVLIFNIETTEFTVKLHEKSLNWLAIEPETER